MPPSNLTIKKPFEPTPEQCLAFDTVITWSKSKSNLEFRLVGPAGVGKTELIRMLMNEFKQQGRRVGIAAFTGKAVCVLHSKDIRSALTLHKSLYRAKFDKETKKRQWYRVAQLPFDIMIVDEASMVSQELYDTIRSYNIPVVYVGDNCQLSPVGKNPHILLYPDFELKTIHRQMAGHPILKYATHVREYGLKMPTGSWDGENGGNLSIVDSIKNIDLTLFDTVLCGYNATRHQMNSRIREKIGRVGPALANDSIVCLKNDDESNLYNGMVFTISKINSMLSNEDRIVGDLDDKIDTIRKGVSMSTKYFGKNYIEDDTYNDNSPMPVDWGMTLTCHRSQGSEYNNVLLMEEFLPEIEHRRWLYTGITRAKNNLTILRNRLRTTKDGYLSLPK